MFQTIFSHVPESFPEHVAKSVASGEYYESYHHASDYIKLQTLHGQECFSHHSTPYSENYYKGFEKNFSVLKWRKITNDSGESELQLLAAVTANIDSVFLSRSCCSFTADHVGYISTLGIAANYRRQGEGRQIMTMIINQIIKECPDVKAITLHVEATNVPAKKLYEALGFVLAYVVADYYTVTVNGKIEKKDGLYMVRYIDNNKVTLKPHWTALLRSFFGGCSFEDDTEMQLFSAEPNNFQ
jgi:ribosomal protein S18 acetylase RimI-like enzyme